ncbi:hypothetical protein ABOM_003142 [Aspergillus bombycis]|uniref:Uncharacterized protein n=1 Tax=Aspergillus bombycis TaxID=109264 RepID=A0A1F8ABG5_9EURO|nr:hypothetical protein ABOM_003142 [Aspergillus bombycis]OGM48991.1 hypothetical protein ABOM_003142 [Aspergillus bombycis]
MPPRFRLIKLVAGTAITGGSSIALLASYTTSDIEFVPLSATDPIFHSKHLREYNPNGNPAIHDLHIARVPLTQIHPRLLEDPNKLLEQYCGGIWAGAGFAPQRILHTCFDRGESSSPQLWSTSELLQSNYKVGTDIAGNFEVVDRSSESILIRAGDKTSNKGLRPLDALIEVGSHIDKENNVAVFEFKSLFFQGIGTTSNLPMPGPIVWLHELYAKILLKSGVQHVLR